METAPVAVAILAGEDLRYQFVNPMYSRLRPPGTGFVGRRYRDLFPRRASAAVPQILKVLRTREPWRIHDFRASLEEERTTWWEGECLPLENERGVVDSVLMLLWDVTDRHIVEEALRESEQRFHQFFELAGVSFWIEDFTEVKQALDELVASGIEDVRSYLEEHRDFVQRAVEMVRIIDVNQAAVELFGALDKQQLMDSRDSVFMPETEDVFIDELVALASRVPLVQSDVVLQRLDERSIDALLTMRFDHDNERYDEVIVTLTDITRRKAIEQELRHANAAKDEFLGMVSHEFRTPIATIMGNVELLERLESTSDERASSIHDLRSSAARLRRLVENMLLLANETMPEFAREPLLLQRALPGIVADEQRLDESHEIRLTMPEGLPPVLASDGFLEQLLGNLFSNARKYGAPGTPITVDVTASDLEVSVSVANDGELVSEEDWSQYFVPFYRDQRTSNRVDGVGLGLAVCKKVTEAMGGEIRARPKPGGGAVFEFTLQIAPDVEQ